jgi:ActR/RegA family two-component response regulator
MEGSTERILLVDDDQAVLDALFRQNRKRYTLDTACGPAEGTRAIAERGPFAVVVSDYQMPLMNGVQFLSKVRMLSPETVRIMLTGKADLTTAIDAVNRGQIFRFLAKPCDPEFFRSCLDAALEQHYLVNAEHLLLEETVRGSIAVLVDIMALSNPAAFGRATRIQAYVHHIASTLGLKNLWQYETAALLSQIGCVAVPNGVIERIVAGETIPPEQAEMIERHPEVAREILGKIPRLQTVADIVGAQRKVFRDDASLPRDVKLGGLLLAAALDFDDLVTLGASPSQAVDVLKRSAAGYGDRILDALETADILGSTCSTQAVPILELEVGMILDEEVRDLSGHLLGSPRQSLTRGSLERLRNYARLEHLSVAEVRVRVLPALAGLEPKAA